MKKSLISASIMCANLLTLKEEIKHLEEAGVDWIHVDVMDGHFVPNMVVGCPDLVRAIKPRTKLPLDVHLMIDKPENHIKNFTEAGLGANDLLVIHCESTDPFQVLPQIKELGVKSGIALRPSTTLTAIKHLLDAVDMILIMTVNPGFAGQAFIEKMLDKIAELKKMIAGSPIDIQVDGGLTPERIQECAEAGANVFVGGTSSIFDKDPPGVRKDAASIIAKIHKTKVNR